MSFVPVKGQFYRVVARPSGWVIDYELGQPLALVPRPWRGSEHQQFLFHPNNQFYNIVARAGGRSMDVPYESKDDGVHIILWNRHDHSTNQQFEILPAGGGAYYIGARHSQKFLCIHYNQLAQHEWTGSEHFQFSFVPCQPFIDPQALRQAVFWNMSLLRQFVLAPPGKEAPERGVKYLARLIWSRTDGNLIDHLRDYVRDNAGPLLSGERMEAMAACMPGLEYALDYYVSHDVPPEDQGNRLTTLLQKIQAAQSSYFDQSAPEKTLPYFLVLGTLHLAALRERYDNFEILYPGRPFPCDEMLDELRGYIKQYAYGAGDALRRLVHWRVDFIKLTPERIHEGSPKEQRGFLLMDHYDGYAQFISGGGHEVDYERARAALESRRRYVGEHFSAEWSVLFGAAPLWRSMNPIEEFQARIAYATSTSAVFGGQRGTTFDGEDETVQAMPIKEIQIRLNEAGDRVLGLSMSREGLHPPRTWGAFHLPGVLRRHHFSEGEWITAAYGNHRGHDESLYSLYLVTNKGNIVGGGLRNRGKSWGSEAPMGLAPKLGTLTCWASARDIEGIAFHWMYGRDG